MLGITRKNCYKCDLETVIDNNSQYFWINLRDFEVETESKWLNIFNKHGNKSTLKYRRQLTPNIKFQADKIFVRNDLLEQVIKNCKATNIEFTMLKGKLGICLYEENYYEEGIIKIQDEEPIKEISEVSTKKSTKNQVKHWLVNQIMNQLMNQLINQLINQLMNQAMNQLMNQIMNQLIINQLMNQLMNQLINQLMNQTINQLKK